MIIEAHIQNAKIESSANQHVTRQAPTVNRGSGTRHGPHEFRWLATKTGGTASCTCGRWGVYGTRPSALTKASAKRSHTYHRANLPIRAKGERKGGANVRGSVEAQPWP
jgi:hypothetical protein